MSRTIKGETVQKYLDGKFADLPINTLALKIYKENSLLFPNKEAVRCAIRYYKGKMGQSNRKAATHPTAKGEEAIKHNIGNPYHLPESDEEVWEPFILPSGKKYLVLSDIHIPYHTISAVTLALEKGKKEGVDAILLNGDILDAYSLSRYEKDPRKRRFSEELQACREFLGVLKKEFDLPVYYKLGNHEDRYESFLRLKAPELLDMSEFKLDVLLRFREYNATLIQDDRVIKAGNLNILHGHEFGRSVFSPVNPARGYYMRSKTNTLCGHNHQTSEHTEPNLNGKITTTWSTGCLCELHPRYMRVNKWNHGFAIVEIGKDGNFEVKNHRIINGKVR